MRRACPRRSTGTSRARRSAAVDGAAQRARVPPADSVDKPSRRRMTTTGRQLCATGSTTPRAPLQSGPFSMHIRGPVSVTIDRLGTILIILLILALVGVI
jgi:hypothetical protein